MVASTQPCAGQIRPLLGVSRSRCDQDVQELWVMDSFAFALSDGIWVRPSVANTQSHTHVPSYVPSYRSISDIISAQALNMIRSVYFINPLSSRKACDSLPLRLASDTKIGPSSYQWSQMITKWSPNDHQIAMSATNSDALYFLVLRERLCMRLTHTHTRSHSRYWSTDRYFDQHRSLSIHLLISLFHQPPFK